MTAGDGGEIHVSTHSRPKAAGPQAIRRDSQDYSFNTQPPEGGWFLERVFAAAQVVFQHTAARRRLVFGGAAGIDDALFQHTAARRRLAISYEFTWVPPLVSTHSRPKAAGILADAMEAMFAASFNTQPPEGGWSLS